MTTKREATPKKKSMRQRCLDAAEAIATEAGLTLQYVATVRAEMTDAKRRTVWCVRPTTPGRLYGVAVDCGEILFPDGEQSRHEALARVCQWAGAMLRKHGIEPPRRTELAAMLAVCNAIVSEEPGVSIDHDARRWSAPALKYMPAGLAARAVCQDFADKTGRTIGHASLTLCEREFSDVPEVLAVTAKYREELSLHRATQTRVWFKQIATEIAEEVGALGWFVDDEDDDEYSDQYTKLLTVAREPVTLPTLHAVARAAARFALGGSATDVDDAYQIERWAIDALARREVCIGGGALLSAKDRIRALVEDALERGIEVDADVLTWLDPADEAADESQDGGQSDE